MTKREILISQSNELFIRETTRFLELLDKCIFDDKMDYETAIFHCYNKLIVEKNG